MHGDLTGAFRTGLPGAVGKLMFNSKDLLIGGSFHSFLMIWQIFEAGLCQVAQKDPGKANIFDAMMGFQEEHRKKELHDPNIEEEEEEEKAIIMPSEPKSPDTKEQVESLDKP